MKNKYPPYIQIICCSDIFFRKNIQVLLHVPAASLAAICKKNMSVLSRSVTSYSKVINLAKPLRFSFYNMSAKVGDVLPSVDLFENTPASVVNTGKLCESGKVLIFAVPGAFTPGCSLTHLPGYVKESEAIKAKGVKELVCVAVNDPFVTAAWGKAQGCDGKIRMLADPCGEFTKALGLGQDLAVLGGLRSKRYSMVVQDGKITQLNVEPDGKGLSCSLVENTLPSL